MRSLIAISLVLAGTCAALPGQVRPGWGVYCTLDGKTLLPSSGSKLVLFSPYNGTGLSLCPTQRAFTPLTNLPRNLTTSSIIGGANCVLVRDSDGSIVAATAGQAGRNISIYHLKITGTRVNWSRTFDLGTAARGTGWRGVQQMVWLDDDRVLFCHHDITSTRTGWPKQDVSELTLSTGRIRHLGIRFPSTTGIVNAMAIDRARSTIYVGFYGPNDIYSVQLSNGAVSRIPTPMPNGLYQLDVDHNGLLYVATWSLGLYSYDFTSSRYTQVVKIRQMNGMIIDRVSGDILMASNVFPMWMFRYDPNRIALMGVPGMHPRDVATGIAIRSSMIPMKTGSRGYRWMVFPNPGGAPLAGNQKFSLTVSTTAKPFQAGLLVSTGLLNKAVKIGGADLWLAAPILQTPMTINIPKTEMSVKLPIPTQASLCGLSFYAQSYAVGLTGLASTRPLQVTFQ